MNSSILLTCEHGGNRVPKKWQHYFAGQKRLLHTHRGWDYGALIVAKLLSKNLKAKLLYSEITRLLVDLNRSLGNPTLHSAYLKPLSADDLEQILKLHYHPYRKQVLNEVRRILARKNKAAHFSIHSFTPVFRGERRHVQIGILFDPASPLESRTAHLLKKNLQVSFPRTRIRYNDPYDGRGDGQTTSLRSRFSQKIYSGIEIEMNQAWLKHLIARGGLDNFADQLATAMVASV